MENKEKENLIVKGVNINYKSINDEDYICLTDIAKAKNNEFPADVVKNWIKNRSTLEYIRMWEIFYNKNVKLVEIDQFISNSGSNHFVLSPQKIVDKANVKCLISKSGKNGGTYAHKDIAFKFASWVSVEFEFYLIKEFQRLKEKEYKSIEWSAKRELAKVNYHIHTSSIKNNLIIPELSKEQIYFTYASEGDLLNVALFGITAGEWRRNNPNLKGNMRDFASIEQLLILANMESYNSILIEQGLKQSERIVLLHNMAKNQIKILQNNKNKIVKKESN